MYRITLVNIDQRSTPLRYQICNLLRSLRRKHLITCIRAWSMRILIWSWLMISRLICATGNPRQSLLRLRLQRQLVYQRSKILGSYSSLNLGRVIAVIRTFGNCLFDYLIQYSLRQVFVTVVLYDILGKRIAISWRTCLICWFFGHFIILWTRILVRLVRLVALLMHRYFWPLDVLMIIDA